MDDFIPYPCSLGTVTAHDENSYIIATADGRTIGIPANGVPSSEAVEADIANPPAPPAPSVEQIWAGKLAGFVTVNGFDLKANRAARNDFSGMFTMLNGVIDRAEKVAKAAEALKEEATPESIAAAGVAARNYVLSSPVEIWDAHEAKHTVPISTCIDLILDYGLAWQAMFNEFAP